MKRMSAVIYVLLAAILWGCIGLFYKGLSALGMTPLQVVLVRVLTAFVLMAAYMAIRRPRWFRIRLRDVWMFLGTGIASLAFFNYCYFTAMDKLSVSVAAVLLYTAPIFVMLLSRIFFRDPFTVKGLIALVLTFGGCSLVTGAFTGGSVTWDGVLFGLGAGLGYALYSIFGVFALRRYESETITFYTYAFALLGVLPLCRPWELVPIVQTAPLETSLYTLGIGLLCCFLPYLFYTKGLSGVRPGQASMMATLEPVVATIIGVAVFGDTLQIWNVIGIVLIIGAIVLLNVSRKKEKR